MNFNQVNNNAGNVVNSGMEKPNPTQTWAEFWGDVQSDLQQYGLALIWTQKGIGESVREMWVLPVDQTFAHTNVYDRRQDYYICKVNSSPNARIPATDVVRLQCLPKEMPTVHRQ